MRVKERNKEFWGVDAFSIAFGVFVMVVGFVGLAGLMGIF